MTALRDLIANLHVQRAGPDIKLRPGDALECKGDDPFQYALQFPKQTMPIHNTHNADALVKAFFGIGYKERGSAITPWSPIPPIR